MRKYLKESLLLIYLALFKPVSLRAAGSEFTNREIILVYLKVLPVKLAIIVTIVALGGILSQSAGYQFNWSVALVGSMIIGLVFGLFFGLSQVGLGGGLWSGLVVGLWGGLALGLGGTAWFVFADNGTWEAWLGGLLGGLGIGLVLGLGVTDGLWLSIGLFVGLVGMLTAGPVGIAIGFVAGALVREVVAGLVVGLAFGLVSALPVAAVNGQKALHFVTAYSSVFLFVYLRPFHLIPYAFQRWRSFKAADPFLFFRNSPVYWDEALAMPLPFLCDWLVRLARLDRERGMNEIASVASLPYQRSAAQRALVKIVVQDLQEATNIERMAGTPSILAVLPSDAKYLPEGLDDAGRHIRRVANLANDYLTRVTTAGQINVLGELRGVVESFRDAMVLLEAPVGPSFQSTASVWLEIVKAEEAECRKRIVFEPIPNPFVVGNPLMVRDHNLFKGRKDIIIAIEENIINPSQRPALLLYGRRRIGKTSTLLNLPRLLSSKFVPVFIDCQDAKWREGDEAFCYHLAASLYDALNQRALVDTSRRPQLERFERYAFTRLGEYLDQIEESSRAAHKQILLTFDEYEKLGEGITVSKVTTEVLNQLRTIVQHRERIVALFSGGHRFEEMRTINWSDYLINVKMLELSFLAPEDARELITEPVPLLQYESGVIEQIIEMTHCQPYLLQAVASDLVNYLNSERRMLATASDLEIAVEKVLVTAQAYFFYIWTEDCSESEREILRAIATFQTNSSTPADNPAALQSLCHKEILERRGSCYRFTIELFRRWILKNQTAQAELLAELSEPSELEYGDLPTTQTH